MEYFSNPFGFVLSAVMHLFFFKYALILNLISATCSNKAWTYLI